MIDPVFFNRMAQMCHFGWAALDILIAGVFFPKRFYLIWIALEIIWAIKEFWYDENYEDALTRGSNLLDFCVYSLGAVCAFLALYFKGLIS